VKERKCLLSISLLLYWKNSFNNNESKERITIFCYVRERKTSTDFDGERKQSLSGAKEWFVKCHICEYEKVGKGNNTYIIRKTEERLTIENEKLTKFCSGKLSE